MTTRRRLRIAAAVAIAIAAALLLGAASRDVSRDLATPRDLHEEEHAGSSECRRCHEERYESWSRTFHRTMTREAARETVLAPFEGETLDYFGVTARMDRDPESGDFRITFVPARGSPRTVRVDRTVGSRRYQQYLAQEGDTWVRLPVAWHVEERRWFHMNGAFLTPDPPEPGPGEHVSEADYDRHVVRWNDNCVFCHNVRPNPGMRANGSMETEVAELGIACEACHGPGTEHARVNASPLRRYALHLFGGDDPTIVSPLDLSPERSAEICGRCHGQRLTDDVSKFLTEGDPYVPGDDLAEYSEPLWRDTPLAGDETAFAARFWEDGTARLTAYEYQGLLQSPCTERGEMTCISCHSMHEGDPRGQIKPGHEGDGACTGCHAGLPRDHTRHDGESSGARCVACHMPRIVYGLVEIHVSHRVESPDPARDAEHGRPDACTSCHVDRSRAWAIAERARLWGDPAPRASAIDPDPPGTSETVRALFAGDPIVRSVAADALGRSDVPAETPGAIALRLGALLDAMENDRYPAVRRIAMRSARALARRAHPSARAPFDAYEATATSAPRRAALTAIRAALPPGAARAPRPDLVAAWRARAEDVAIEIGE